MCFVDGSYAERFSEGAMLGYVQSEDVLYWKRCIQQIVQKDPRGNLRLVGAQNDSLVHADFPHEWVSDHDRISGRHILVYHILLDCTPSVFQVNLNIMTIVSNS